MAVVVVLAVVGAYVTLPWWVPTGLLRAYLAGNLSRLAGVKVSIGAMSVSWSRGAELRDVKIPSAEPFGPEPLADIRCVRADFSPLRLIFGRRIAWMALEGVSLSVRANREGQVNFRPLIGLMEGPEVKRLSVHGMDVRLTPARQARTLHLDVRDLQYVAGRARGLGRVTMCAVLQPQGNPAPVSLNVALGASEETAANASFSFVNLDLEQLDLPNLLGLALERLHGRCDGSLQLRVNPEGRVDQFSLNLDVSDLDVQPADERVPRLPVIHTAHLHVTAACDLVKGPIEIQSASILLPGIRVAGRAKMFSEVLEGRWEGISSLDVAGTVYPMQLAALLTGKSLLPGEFAVSGPVAVALAAQRDGPLLGMDVSVDATKAEVRRHGRILKPLGRDLRVGLVGLLDDRSWDLALKGDGKEGTVVRLGENSMTLRGVVRGTARLAERFEQADGEGVPAAALEGLRHLDCTGQWELRELESLAEALPALGPALSEIRLRGPIMGRWTIAPHAEGRVRAEAHLELAGAAAARIGERIVTPADEFVALGLRCEIDPDERAFQRADLDLHVGEGRFHFAGTGRGSGDGFELDGKLRLERVQDLLRCVPDWPKLGVSLAGTTEGRCRLGFGSGLREARLALDLTGMTVAWGRWLQQGPNQLGRAEIDIVRDDAAPADQRLTVGGTWRSNEPGVAVRFNASAAEPALGAGVPDGRFAVTAEFSDAAWLVRSCPFLKERLGQGALRGPMTASASGALTGQTLDAELHCDASGLELALGGRRARTKSGGVPLALDAKGRLTRRDDRTIAVDLASAVVKLGNSSADLSGAATLSDGLDADRTIWPPPAGTTFRAALNASCRIEDALTKALPELAEAIRRYGLSGQVGIQAKVSGDGKAIRLSSHADAADLAVGPLALASADELPWARLGRVAKPLKLPAEIGLEATVPADVSRLRVNELRVRAGELELLADGEADVVLGPDGLPVRLGPTTAHVTVRTTRAAGIERLFDALAPCRLTGDLFIEAQLRADGQVEVPYLTFDSKALCWHSGGKDVMIGGQVRLENLGVAGGRVSGAGRIKTDGLEFRVGANHGWLLADIVDLPGKPTGKVQLLGEYLDDKNIADWLSPPDPAAPREGKLADAEAARLVQKARSSLDWLRPYMLASRLDLQAQVGHLRTFDASVGQSYDLKQMRLGGSLKDGQVKIRYGVGLNGGSVYADYAVNFADEDPVLVCDKTMEGVIATESIQPQLAKYFPGNTVFGTFTRNEQVTFPLNDLLASALDARYQARPVGKAKTIATDGLLEGRAAPMWMTTLLPGLNLARYRYNRMTSFATYDTEGVAHNDMIFSGKIYDMYIEGTTDPDNIGRYRIGVILVSAPQTAEWNHAWRAGRIPILKFKARIEGGKKHDEEVDYLRPDETLVDILVKNNPINRILINVAGWED